MTTPIDRRDVTTESIVVATKDQVSSDLAGETVLLSMDTGRYYGLGDVGSRIWELVRNPVRVSDICGVISQEYDVETERCEADVLRFLRDMLARSLIEVKLGA